MSNKVSEINADIVFKDISNHLTEELHRAAQLGQRSLSLTLDQKYYEQLLPSGLTLEQVQQVRETDAAFLNGLNNVFTNAVENFYDKTYVPNGQNVEFFTVNSLMGGDHVAKNGFCLRNEERGEVIIEPTALAGVTYNSDQIVRQLVASDALESISALVERRFHEAAVALMEENVSQSGNQLVD